MHYVLQYKIILVFFSIFYTIKYTLVTSRELFYDNMTNFDVSRDSKSNASMGCYRLNINIYWCPWKIPPTINKSEITFKIDDSK